MLDGIPIGSLANGIGVVAVIVLIGWLVFTDRLVPRRSVDRLTAMWEARLAEKESRIKDLLAANEKSANQAEELTAVGQTLNRVMTSIEQLAKRRAS